MMWSSDECECVWIVVFFFDDVVFDVVMGKCKCCCVS